MATPPKNYTAGSKSILAKLLATEDLRVVHESTPTAYFDVKNRVLHCPIFESMNGELYDLFMGHEVGHAMFTPAEGWHSSIEESGDDPRFKGFLNVLEDARIEKLIKNKYPGLSRSFSIAYKDLYARNFFGVLGMNSFSALNLIDRINLHFKCGHFLFITFSPQERAFVKEVTNLSDWEEVVGLAKRIYEYVKSNEQNKINDEHSLKEYAFSLNSEDSDADSDSENFKDELDPDADVKAESEEEEETGDTQNKPETKAEDSGQSSDETLGDEQSQEEEESQSDYSSSMQFDEDYEEEYFEPLQREVESVTDSIFRKKEHELVIDAESVKHVTISDLKYSVQFLDGVQLAKDRLNKIVDELQFVSKPMYEQFIKFAKDEFNKRNRSYINHMVQQFEMKKNAKIYSRTSQSKSGVLDMKKISKYRISSDIFLKSEKRERGKSHGLVMFLDVSSSMLAGQKLSKSIEQVLALTEFCRKTNIPFEVYSFSSSTRSQSVKYTEEDEIIFNNAFDGSVTKLLTNQQTKQQYDLVYDMLLSYYITMEVPIYSILGSIQNADFDAVALTAFNPTSPYLGIYFGSTPMNKTILGSLQIINKFKKDNLVDIVNTIHFTDGEGTDTMYHRSSYIRAKRIKKIILADRDTGTVVEVPMSDVNGQQNMLTQFVSEATGCKHIGFFFSDKKSLLRGLFNALPYSDYLVEKKVLHKMGYTKVIRQGYSDYYCVATEGNNSRDSSTGKKRTKAMIQSDFVKEQSKKYTRRLIANKFIENICE